MSESKSVQKWKDVVVKNNTLGGNKLEIISQKRKQ